MIVKSETNNSTIDASTLIFPGDCYRTPDRPGAWFAKRFPSLSFYPRLIHEVFHIASILRRGECRPDTYAQSSLTILRALEKAGVHFDIENLDALRSAPDPFVLAANHMSSLETFALHSIFYPRPAAYIIKRSLLSYPVFGPVLSYGGSIAVDRKNPRQDLETVLKEGKNRLEQGISVIVFPQTTRQLIFDPERFNTIAVKLARRGGVAILPLALKTDAWGFGRIVKDFGPIDPRKTVRFRFGEAMTISGNGKAEHEAIVRFIQNTLAEWRMEEEKTVLIQPVHQDTPEAIHQAGTIPWRIENGRVRVLLVTRRNKGAWIFPKGKVEDGLSHLETSEKETYEEAGVRGKLDPEAVGEFYYLKGNIPCRVRMFWMEVTEELIQWPEMDRRRRWADWDEAIHLVDFEGLRILLESVDKPWERAPAAKS